MGRSIGSALSLATALIASGAALAYPTPIDFDGELLRWNITIEDQPISYRVTGAAADVERLTVMATQAATFWSDVPTSYLQFRPAADDEREQVTIELVSSFDGDSFSSGYALFDDFDDEGNPLHCLIRITVSADTSFFAFGKTVLHELGHCVGLGHSMVPVAIMSYSLDKNTFALSADDEAGVSRLYPADGTEPTLPLGCAISKGSKRSTPPLYLLIPLIIIATFAARIRNRQKSL